MWLEMDWAGMDWLPAVNLGLSGCTPCGLGFKREGGSSEHGRFGCWEVVRAWVGYRRYMGERRGLKEVGTWEGKGREASGKASGGVGRCMGGCSRWGS